MFSCIGYIFWHKDAAGKWMCIDATAESSHPGRLINHSRQRPNLVVKSTKGNRLVFKAIKNIEKGHQLLFDYNDNRKEVLESNMWMNN